MHEGSVVIIHMYCMHIHVAIGIINRTSQVGITSQLISFLSGAPRLPPPPRDLGTLPSSQPFRDSVLGLDSNLVLRVWVRWVFVQFK